MGTRADFYAGGTDPATMRWLGSIGWDGYPQGIPVALFLPTSEGMWEATVQVFLRDREDATLPSDGWPWPWEDSRTTDYAYTWTDEGVRCSCFGQPWFDPTADPADEEPHDGQKVPFPNMAHIQNIAWDKRSGLIVLGVEPERKED